MFKRKNEAGDSLIEIIFAVVIMGIIVSALFASFTTASNASGGNRDLVKADATLRNYAEATKSAVRNSCISVGAKYRVDYPSLTPSGFSPGPDTSSALQSCPPTTGPLATPTVPLSVKLPNSRTKSLSIKVRTP